jgi:hypothetical protein
MYFFFKINKGTTPLKYQKKNKIKTSPSKREPRLEGLPTRVGL